MSVVEFNKALNVVILNHKLFLESLYGKLQSCSELLSTFNIKTPFRMDLEADKVARMIEVKDLKESRIRKRRKKHKCLVLMFNAGEAALCPLS